MGFDGVKKQDRKSHAWAPLTMYLELGHCETPRSIGSGAFLKIIKMRIGL